MTTSRSPVESLHQRVDSYRLGSMSSRNEKDQRRLYGDLAWTWPIISPPEDYAKESEEIAAVMREVARIEAKTLLHLGCGGGHIDFTLKRHFQVTGLDVSEEMLALARGLNPGIEYIIGDMRAVRLGRGFDAVLIADSIDYMLTEAELRSAFQTALAHLEAGGVFVTCPDVTRESFKQNRMDCSTHARGGVAVTFIEDYHDPDPTDTTYESTFVYLIRRGGELEIETDRHLCGVFPLETWPRLLEEAGFQVEQRELAATPGFPVFVCVRPS